MPIDNPIRPKPVIVDRIVGLIKVKAAKISRPLSGMLSLLRSHPLTPVARASIPKKLVNVTQRIWGGEPIINMLEL